MFKFGFLSNAMQLKCFIIFSILICGRQLYTKKEKKIQQHQHREFLKFLNFSAQFPVKVPSQATFTRAFVYY